MKKDCLHIVFNEFTFDSRVKKIARISSEMMNTTVLCFSENLSSYELDFDSYRVKKIGLWFRYWKFFSPLRHILAYVEFLFKFMVSLNLPSLKIIHVHDMKPMAISVMVKLFSLGRVKIIYDCHEYETETDDLNGKELKKKLLRFYEFLLVRIADKVITVSPKIASEYAMLYKTEEPEVVLNCPPYRNPGLKKNILREKFQIAMDKKIFLYQGAIVRGRGVEETIKAFENGVEDVVVFLGYGELESLVRDAARKSQHIFFHEAVSPTLLIDYTSSADFGICFAPNICLSYDYSLSNKIFEYTQARLPIIVSNLSEIRRFVTENKIGVVIGDTDFESIRIAVRTVSSLNMEQTLKCLDISAEKYSWEHEASKLRAIYSSLLN